MSDFLDKQKVTLDGETINATFTPPAAGVTKHLHTKTTNLAFNTSVNHDYTVPAGKKWKISRVVLSSTAASRGEIASGPSASLITKAVIFTNATRATAPLDFTPTLDILEAGGGEKITVFITNLGQATDVYSTVMLEEVTP